MNLRGMKILLTCLFAYHSSADEYYNDLGTYVAKSGRIFFTDTTTTVFLSRHYPNTCTEAKLDDYQRATSCANVKAKEVEAIFNAIIDECDKAWNEQVQQLKSSIPQPRAKRQNITEPVREKRELATILTGISIFSTLLSSLTGLFSHLYHFFKHEELSLQQQFLKETMQVKAQQSNLIAANVAKNSYTQINILSDALCNTDILASLKIKQLQANIILRENVKIMEQEVLSLSYGDMPRNLDFLNIVHDLCTRVEANDETYCREVIYANEIEIIFDGVTVQNDIVVGLIRLEMPVQSRNFHENFHYEITNMGNYNKDQFFYVPLPKYALMAQTKTVYTLDTDLCKNHICHINSVRLDNDARCFQSLLLNKTEHCVRINSEEPGCIFKKVELGTIIVANHAIYFPTSKDSVQAITLRKRSILTKTAGRLLCIGPGFNSTHIISAPGITIRGYSKLKPLEDINVKHGINITRVTKIDSEAIELAKNLETIYESDDHLEINGTNYGTLYVIVFFSVLCPVVIAIIFIISHNREFLKIKFQTYLRWVWPKRRTRVDIRPDNSQIDTELVDQTDKLVLKNGSKVEIYPKLDNENEH